MLISVLKNTDCLKTLCTVCLVLCDMLTKKWSIFTTSDKILVYSEVLNKLAKNEKIRQNQIILDSLVRLLCRIAKFSCNQDIEFAKLPQYCIEFLSQNAEIMKVGLEIIKGLIEDMKFTGETQSIAHERNARQFNAWTLPFFFRETVACLAKIVNSDGEVSEKQRPTELILEIIAMILKFSQETDPGKGMVLLHTHESFWQALKDPIIIDQFCALYNLHISSQKSTQSILKILGLIAIITPEFFGNNLIRSEIINKILNFILFLVNSKLGLDVEANLHEFILMLSKVFKNSPGELVVNSEIFGKVIEKAYLMTGEILLPGPRYNENFVCNMLEFWENLSEFMGNNSVIVEVIRAYLQFYLVNFEDLELKMVKENIKYMCTMSKSDFGTVASWVLKIFQDFVNGAENPKKISILICIFCGLIADDKTSYINASKVSVYVKPKNSDESTPERHLAKAEIIQNMLIFLNHLAENPQAPIELLENSLVFFKYFVNIYLRNSTASAKNTLKVVFEKLNLASDTAFLVLLLSPVFRISNSSEVAYKVSMEIFTIIGRSTLTPDRPFEGFITCGALRVEKCVITEIFNNWAKNSFADSQFINKSRLNFVSILFKMYFLVESILEEITLEMMLVPLDFAIGQVIAQKSLSAVKRLVLDLLGLHQAISSLSNYESFFKWFEGKITLLLEIFEIFCMDAEICSLYLNLIIEISLNRSERLTGISNKAAGLTVFRFCEKVILMYLQSVNFEQKGQHEKLIAKAVKIFSNMLRGNYVNLEVCMKDQQFICNSQFIISVIMMIGKEEIALQIARMEVLYDLFKFLSSDPKRIKLFIYPLTKIQGEKLLDFIGEGCQSFSYSICLDSLLFLKSLINDIILKPTGESNIFFQTQRLAFIRILKVLMGIVFGGEPKYIENIAFPLLGLINLCKEEYTQLFPALCLLQGPERKEM